MKRYLPAYACKQRKAGRSTRQIHASAASLEGLISTAEIRTGLSIRLVICKSVLRLHASYAYARWLCGSGCAFLDRTRPRARDKMFAGFGAIPSFLGSRALCPLPQG